MDAGKRTELGSEEKPDLQVIILTDSEESGLVFGSTWSFPQRVLLKLCLADGWEHGPGEVRGQDSLCRRAGGHWGVRG